MPLSPWCRPGRWLLFFALVVAVGVTGCGGGGTGTVTGKVTYNGQPVKAGTVIFIGDDKQGRRSEIAEDGSYTIDAIPVGLVRISVETDSVERKAKAPKIQSTLPPGAPNKGLDPEVWAKRFVKIPGQYAEPETSGLSYTVKRGKQEHPIDLK